jgi:hypothetical protein
MGTRKTPREKKELEYDRDTRVVAEYPKSYRKNKPRKKKLANQLERRRVDRMMGAAIASGHEEELTDPLLQPRSQSTIHNLTVRLGDFIERQRHYRKGRAGKKAKKRKTAEMVEQLRTAIKAKGARFEHVSLDALSWAREGAITTLHGCVSSPAALRELKEIVSLHTGPKLTCDVSEVRVARNETWRQAKKERNAKTKKH